MSYELGHLIRAFVSDGLQVNIWPTQGDQFQANLKERGSDGWTVVVDTDPIEALCLALKQRGARLPDRQVVIDPEPPAPPADEFEDMLG